MAFRSEAVRTLPLGGAAIAGAVLFALLVAWLLPVSPYAALLPILLAILLTPLLRAPHLAPAVVLLFVPLLSGMERGAIVPIFRANELVLIFVFFAYLITIMLGPKRKIEFTFLDRAFIIFVLARSVLPLVVHPIAVTGDPTNLAKFFLAPLQYFLLYRLIQDTTRDRRDLMLLFHVLIVGGMVVAVVGLLQAARLPQIEDFLQTYYPSNKPMYTFVHSQRVTSLFGGGWNVCGFYLSQILLLTIAVHPLERPGLPRAALVAAGVLAGFVMALSFSFSTSITLLVALILLAQRRKRLRTYLLRALPVVAVGAGMVAIFFAAPLKERLELQFRGSAIPITLLVRINFWRETAWPLIKDSLVFGIGPQRFTRVTAESEYVYLVATCGLVGLSGFIGFIVYMWRKLLAIGRRFAPSTLEGTIAILGLAFFIQNLIASTTGHYFEYSGASELLWGMWGMLLVCVKIQRRESEGRMPDQGAQ